MNLHLIPTLHQLRKCIMKSQVTAKFHKVYGIDNHILEKYVPLVAQSVASDDSNCNASWLCAVVADGS
jgi:hypothetical protein